MNIRIEAGCTCFYEKRVMFMGRIKQVAIKNLGNEVIEKHGKKFSIDFDKNKEALATMKDIKSKKVRNVVAGYITKEMQKIKKSGL